MTRPVNLLQPRWHRCFDYLVTELWWRGASCTETAIELNEIAPHHYSRHAVSGRRRRLGLRGRPSPLWQIWEAAA